MALSGSASLIFSIPETRRKVSCDWSVHRQKKTKEINGQRDVGSFSIKNNIPTWQQETVTQNPPMDF